MAAGEIMRYSTVLNDTYRMAFGQCSSSPQTTVFMEYYPASSELPWGWKEMHMKESIGWGMITTGTGKYEPAPRPNSEIYKEMAMVAKVPGDNIITEPLNTIPDVSHWNKEVNAAYLVRNFISNMWNKLGVVEDRLFKKLRLRRDDETAVFDTLDNMVDSDRT